MHQARLRRHMRRRLLSFAKRYAIIEDGKVTEEAENADRTAISVVVPCYNHSKYLPLAIQSLAKQTLPAQDIVFVNDFATDDTRDVLEAALRSSGLSNRSHCTVLENPSNMGQAASLNRGIDVCTTDVIMVLNDDDYLFHDALEVALGVLHQHHELALLGGRNIDFDTDASIELYSKEILRIWNIEEIGLRLFPQEAVLRFNHQNDFNTPHSGCSFLKCAWRAVEGYCTQKRDRVVPFSDRDFQFRVNLLFPIGLLDAPVSFWRSNSSVDSGKFT